MTRANPWYPFSRAQCDAAGNSAMRCPTRAAERADTFARERSGTLLRVTSRVKGCGGGEGFGVEAYIVSGICACTRDCSMRARCSARARCERGEVEAFLLVRQANDYPALGEQREKHAPIHELRDQPMFPPLLQPAARTRPAPGQGACRRRWRRPGAVSGIAPGRRRPRGSNGATSMPFGIVSTGPLTRPVAEIASETSWLTQIRIALSGEVAIELSPLVGVPNMLDKIDSGMGDAVDAAREQVAPVHPGEEQQVAVRRLPVSGHDPVAGGPEPPALARLRLARRRCAERDARRKARYPPYVTRSSGSA